MLALFQSADFHSTVSCCEAVVQAVGSSTYPYLRRSLCLLLPQAPHDISQTDFARHMLGQIKKTKDSTFHPFVACVDKSVNKLIKNAVTVATSTGAVSATAAASSQEAAERYYKPVLWQLCAAALKLHLQVQGTTDTTFVYVPGGGLGWIQCWLVGVRSAAAVDWASLLLCLWIMDREQLFTLTALWPMAVAASVSRRVDKRVSVSGCVCLQVLLTVPQCVCPQAALSAPTGQADRLLAACAGAQVGSNTLPCRASAEARPLDSSLVALCGSAVHCTVQAVHHSAVHAHVRHVPINLSCAALLVLLVTPQA